MLFRIMTLNNIAEPGLARLPAEKYQVGNTISDPHAIVVRSRNMHEMNIPASVCAVARAGAGVNNIPVAALSNRGIPVLNAPGANANAVKELVIAGMLLACRNLCQAWDYVRGLGGEDAAIEQAVEAGKKRFVGFELPGRTLGVIGLGAIGVQVANTAQSLGMRVLGHDPDITVQRAWQLSSSVAHIQSLDTLLAESDFVTVHVPLTDGTRQLINKERLERMKTGAVLLNFARGGIVDHAAVRAALETEHLHAFVTDFPTSDLLGQPGVIALPHLGASTREAEENCAVMVINNLREFLENGNIRYSVNFPDVVMPRTRDHRLAVANANVPNMVGQITTCLADADLNIVDMLNKSRETLAYTLVDVNAPIPDTIVNRIRAIEGVLSVRTFE